MTDRKPLAPSMSDTDRIAVNRLVHSLVRCTDQTKCDEIEAKVREIEGKYLNLENNC